MTPSKKSDAMEASLIRIFGYDRREYIKNDRCVPKPNGCGGPATEFKDEKSRKEYSISGFCQKCQDKVFP